MNKRGNSVLASNILKYLRSTSRNGLNDSNCLRIKSVEHISERSESNAGDVVVFKSLKDVQIKNLNRIVLVHLNINSLRNKFDLLTDQIKGNVDVLVVSETKLDDSFPTGQFKIPGYASPFRLDRDENGGGIMVFVREDIPVKFLSSENKPIEAFFFELNFHKKKWLVCCSYNPNKNNISSHLEALRRSLYIYSALYENAVLVLFFLTLMSTILLWVFSVNRTTLKV